MSKPRRKSRYCRNCGKLLGDPRKTGWWWFCNDVCLAQYEEEHEPEGGLKHILAMRPTDEDNDGAALDPAPPEET